MGENKKKEWTIFFLIKAPGREIAPIIEMINEIRSIPLKEDLAIVFCLNIIKENIKALEKGDISIMAPDDSPITPTTVFYSLASSKTRSGLLNPLNFISEKQDFDLTDPDHLEDYFRNFILLPFEANRYLLFTFDHGNAFRIFTETENDPPSVKTLTMEELNIAIRWALGKKKIDLVIMLNCYMQSIVTGFALHRSVKYLVAPEPYISFTGYNYAFIFNLLMSKPEVSAKSLAKHAVSSFPRKIYSNNKQGLVNKNITAIFALKLKHYDLFPQLFDQLIIQLLNLTPFPLSQIKEARSKEITFGGTDDLVDFYSFLRNLEKLGVFNGHVIILSLLCSIIELMVIEGYVGDSLKKDPQTFNGLSIYFPLKLKPESLTEENSRINQFLLSAFGKKTKWKELLFKLIDNNNIV